MGINEFGETGYKQQYKQRKPQTRQQILARNEGRSLGSLGMIESNIRELAKMDTITQLEAMRLCAPIYDLKHRVLGNMKERMIKAGTWKEGVSGL